MPCIDLAGPFLAVYGDLVRLQRLREFIYGIKELLYYQPIIDKAFVIFEYAKTIMTNLQFHTKLAQNELKSLLNTSDGKLIGLTIQYLEKIDKIEKLKKNKTYEIIKK